MVTFSLCLIVKNEELVLKNCLESYKDAFDEIVIVDTGSSDNTKQIAMQYTDKIYDFTWINDFSAARNFAFSKCNCDYIFSADADEVLTLDNLNDLLKLKAVLMPEVEIVTFLYVNDSKVNMAYNFKTERRAKLFKRIRQFRWMSPIHETIRLTPIIFDSDIKISHRPITNHAKRDFEIYYKSLNCGTTFLDYVVRMFTKELFISGDKQDFLKAKPYMEKMLSINKYKDDTLKNIYVTLIRCNRLEENLEEFFRYVSLELANNPCAETCMELGYHYEDNEDYKQAILWFINAATETYSLIDIHSSKDAPRLELAKCYRNLANNCTDDDEELRHNLLSLANLYQAEAENMEFPEVDD